MSEGGRSHEEVTKDLFWALEKLEELEIKHEGALQAIKALGEENDELLQDLQGAVTEIEEMEVNSALLCRQVAFLQEENNALKNERDALSETLLQLEDNLGDNLRPGDLKEPSTKETIEQIRQEERRRTLVILKEKDLAHQTIVKLQTENNQMQQRIEELMQKRQLPVTSQERQESDSTLGSTGSRLYSMLDRVDELPASGWINQAVDLFVKRERVSDDSLKHESNSQKECSPESVNKRATLRSFKTFSTRFNSTHQTGTGKTDSSVMRSSTPPISSSFLSQSSHCSDSSQTKADDLVCDFGHARRSFSLDLASDFRRRSQASDEEDLARRIREQIIPSRVEGDISDEPVRGSYTNVISEVTDTYPSLKQYSASLKTIDNEISGLMERPMSVPPVLPGKKKVRSSPVA